MTSWTPTWGTISQNIASWTNTARTLVNSFLLREDGSYILREDGYKIIREDSTAGATAWSNIVKS